MAISRTVKAQQIFNVSGELPSVVTYNNTWSIVAQDVGKKQKAPHIGGGSRGKRCSLSIARQVVDAHSNPATAARAFGKVNGLPPLVEFLVGIRASLHVVWLCTHKMGPEQTAFRHRIVRMCSFLASDGYFGTSGSRARRARTLFRRLDVKRLVPLSFRSALMFFHFLCCGVHDGETASLD